MQQLKNQLSLSEDDLIRIKFLILHSDPQSQKSLAEAGKDHSAISRKIHDLFVSNMLSQLASFDWSSLSNESLIQIVLLIGDNLENTIDLRYKLHNGDQRFVNVMIRYLKDRSFTLAKLK